MIQQADTTISSIPQAKLQFDAARTQLRAGDAEAAVATCDKALKQYAGDANILCLAARANLALQRFDKAKLLLDDCVRLYPDFAIAHDVVGDCLFAQGFVLSAVRAYEQALRLDPTSADVLPKIERAHELARKAEAPRKATEAEPRRRMAFMEDIHKAEQLSHDGDVRQAEDIYRKILKHDPNHVEAARLLAKIASDNKRFENAEVFLRHAVAITPDYTRLWVDLANVLRELHKWDEAMECAEKVLELAPDLAESHMLYAGVVGLSNRHEEAIESYEKALELSPNRPGALCSMAHHLKTIGKQEQAISAYRKCVEIKPDHAEAYWSLANLKTFQFDDSEIGAMSELLENGGLPDESSVQIHNALGLDSESRGEYDNAYSHFERCNTLRRKSETYDPVEMETRFDKIIDIFDEEFLKERTGHGSPDTSPIFVVGLPRSGSTLIEQILASHSEVDGTHELIELVDTVKGLRRSPKKKSTFPDTLPGLSREEWHDLGQAYIESTHQYRVGAPYFIDKNPNNFTFVGLLRLALPNAKIINAKRHPLDSCFGTYKQLFASGQAFSYDFTELGEYYLQYARIMEHWRQLMPGFVLDVQYEQVVEDLETQVRRILEYCGLPFEDACLRFHETDRAVKTASSEQVRRPIYASSVNLWRNYEPHIGELIEVLEPLLQKLPENQRPYSI
jgi:tetratricopeptide (TPR) repeat protein